MTVVICPRMRRVCSTVRLVSEAARDSLPMLRRSEANPGFAGGPTDRDLERCALTDHPTAASSWNPDVHASRRNQSGAAIKSRAPRRLQLSCTSIRRKAGRTVTRKIAEK